MSNSKYEITDIAHKTYPFLHRIRALQDIGDWAKAGDLGGFVESESNLAVDPDDAAWIFNDAIACMDWGYNKCENCLALGFANGLSLPRCLCVGDVIVRLCKGGIFKEEVYKKIHDSQSQSCICLSWRAVQNHVMSLSGVHV